MCLKMLQKKTRNGYYEFRQGFRSISKVLRNLKHRLPMTGEMWQQRTSVCLTNKGYKQEYKELAVDYVPGSYKLK